MQDNLLRVFQDLYHPARVYFAIMTGSYVTLDFEQGTDYYVALSNNS